MDQHLAKVDVSALADAQQPGLASGRVLPWNESEPRCKISALAECRTVADGGNDSRSYDGSDAGDLPDTAATGVARSDLFEPVGQLVDLLLDGLRLIP